MIDLHEKGKATFDWWQDWRGECAAIIGAGPSVKKEDVEKLKDRIHVIAINESHRLCPWAEILYSCDLQWWRLRNGAKDFAGLKLTQDKDAARMFPDVKKITVQTLHSPTVHSNDLLVDTPGVVGSGGNGGFQMTNLLVQFGITGIMLLGFDMRAIGGKVHWHGNHPEPLWNPQEGNYQLWRTCFAGIAPKLKALDIDVVNCSPASTLNAFPKITVDDALKRWTL